MHLAERALRKKEPVGGMILQSPLASVLRIAFPFVNLNMYGDLFCSLNKLQSNKEDGFGCPIYVIHGEDGKQQRIRVVGEEIINFLDKIT